MGLVMQYSWLVTLSTCESTLGLWRSLCQDSDTSLMDTTSILQGVPGSMCFQICVSLFTFLWAKTNFRTLSLCSRDGAQLWLCSLSTLESKSCLVKVVLQSLNAHKEGFEHLSHIMWVGQSKQKVSQLKSGSDDWVKWYKTGEWGWECVFAVNRGRSQVWLVQDKSDLCTVGKATS